MALRYSQTKPIQSTKLGDLNRNSLSKISNKLSVHNPPQLQRSYSSAMGNPQLQKIKLPNLYQSQRLFSSLNERNSKFKVRNLSDKLDQLQMNVHNTRLQAKSTLQDIRLTKDKLITGILAPQQKQLYQKIDVLKKLVKATKYNHEDRSNALRQNYIKLWNQTEKFKQMIFQLNLRADRIQQNMGYQCRN